MRWSSPILALLCSLATSAAHAQTEVVTEQLQLIQGTLSVQHAPQMADGRLTGCSLLYEVLQQDRVYLQGNFVRVSGNVGLMEGEGRLAVVVKVVAVELDSALPDLIARVLPPDRAYLVSSDLSTNFDSLVASYPSDTPGGFFAIFQLEPGINAMFEAMDTGIVTVAFALEGGSMDIQMPIQLNVVGVNQDGSRVRSDAALLQFFRCAQSLMELTLK